METTTSKPAFSFLRGGGEMGELTRHFNWSQTTIGSPDGWPQSLRTTLSILLNSRFPMFLFWGPELLCFYNDAYRPSLGNEGKHPFALGRAGAAVWPEIWPVIKPLIDQVLSGGEATWSEDQLLPIYRNGTLEDVYWTFSYSPVADETGQPAGVFVTCTETTEKVKNLEALKENKDQLAFAIEATGLGVWDLNPLTNKFTANERLKEWFGLRPGDETELSTAVNAIVEKDRAKVAAAMQKALQPDSGGDYEIEYAITHPVTKRERIVRAKGRAWFGEDKIAYRFNGTLQDITEPVVTRKKVEEAEERSRLSIDAAGLGTFELDLATDTLVTSPRFNALFDVDPLSPHSGYLNAIHPNDLAVREQAFSNALKTGVLEYEARVVWKDGSVHWTRAKGVVSFDAAHKPVKLLGVVQDITKEKNFAGELEKQVKERTLELQAMNKELQRSNSHLEEFAHAASHDLKEPIRKIHFFTERLKTQLSDKLNGEDQRMFERVEYAGKRMNALIDDLLLYSHVSQRPHETEAVDLNDKLKKVAEDLELNIQKKSAVVTIGELPVVQGYRRQLQQLFQNLLSNALKYSRRGVVPEISITAAVVAGSEAGLPAERTYHRITVTDNGIGFEQEHAEKIFQMFQRLHGRNEYEGTGVGLSIVRKVVENHNGKVTAESSPGEGASFKIYLPAE